ncbi:MAG: iron-sulfur cluster assembly scaffold protein [Gammaproteobacteria bacterium]|nr:iron-sulfur cluster assembly scaffold protein [Gammaproteobacteria bacterium]MBU6510226.1 iron-sulfur cluster assembly scaffold protein [Gammaproteobacteria bacterium]MDE1984467.1 iron-sulfur cluster assembly scaffold protein [Gammaproteobacteria bacterium]MDE2108792.1 iron-sulfur cluster assembly scaffold protein [Gammaproteobacteria bacterium]MDE2461722.1 iron-sulfur cluster assembly scaffold protein [Gammaproteobacteria bacterium]
MRDPFSGYGDTVQAHFRAPHNTGRFASGDARVFSGSAGARRHGRQVEFQLRVTDAGRIGESRYRVYGCPATIALCSLASDALQGRTAAEAAVFSVVALAEQLQLPAEKRDAALTVEDAIRAAVGRYNSAQGPASAARVSSQVQV